MALPAILAWLLPTLASAVAGYVANRATSKPAEFKQQSPLNPQQQQVQNQGLEQLMQLLQQQSPQGEYGFNNIADEYTHNFNTNTIPGLAERFTAFAPGAESAQRSSAFQGSLGAAGADLNRSLAAMKAQYGQNQQGYIAQLLQAGLQPQNNAYSPSQPGIVAQA